MSRPGAIRAPRQNGVVVANPPLHQFADLFAGNVRLGHQSRPALLGRDWQELSQSARTAAVALARRYLGSAVPPANSSLPLRIVMAGHQPEIFHPGVWLKNFALGQLARASEAISLNLVVDNDTVKATSMKLPDVPAREEQSWPHVVQVPYDSWAGEIPFEEKQVEDEELFQSFEARARTHMRHWGFEPFLKTFWAEVSRQAERTRNLGERFAAARRHFERSWGVHNLEVPASSLCETEPFAWFTCHLLGNLPEFLEVYNRSVEEYRQRNGIRSRSHPVPNLAVENGWREAPFWCWERGSGRRNRLFVKSGPDHLELRSGDSRWPLLPLHAGVAGQETVAAYLGLATRVRGCVP